MAANRAGISRFIFPQMNQRELNDLPTEVRRKMTFVPVSRMEEVLAEALVSQETASLLAV